MLLVAVLPACTGDGGGQARTSPRDEQVVVGSFNFPESELVAEIYAGALEEAGVPVRREMGLGPRELVQPALLDGLVDVVPEYLGTALSSLTADPRVDTRETGVVRRRLADALTRWEVHVLDPAPGQNQNGFAVTKEMAERLGLRKVSHLSRLAGVVVGGPPECPGRRYCLPGLSEVYDVSVTAFIPFETERQRVTALREKVVDVAVTFTTDGELAGADLVLLEDDRHLQPAENIVPLITKKVVNRYGRPATEALGSVSAKLTTENLRFLNWRVSVVGNDVGAEARGWLARHGLVRRG